MIITGNYIDGGVEGDAINSRCVGRRYSSGAYSYKLSINVFIMAHYVFVYIQFDLI